MSYQSKKELRKALEGSKESRNSDRQYDAEQRNNLRAEIAKYEAFLDNLALAVPEVIKYQTGTNDWGNAIWDFDGLAEVVKLRQTERLADRYIPKPTKESNEKYLRDLDEKRSGVVR